MVSIILSVGNMPDRIVKGISVTHINIVMWMFTKSKMYKLSTFASCDSMQPELKLINLPIYFWLN